jgi:drug/metabolite transporter (DMT)-like permease
MISFSGVWVKVCHVSSTSSAFYRVLFGGLFLLAAAWCSRQLKRFEWRHLLLGLLRGFFFSVDLVCYHISINYVGPGLGTILPNFQVFILAFAGAVFLGERVRPATFLTMPVAVAGLFLVIGYEWHTFDILYRTGIYAGLAAAVFYSLFILSLRKLQAEQGGTGGYQVLMSVSFIAAGFISIEMLRAGESFQIPDLQSLGALAVLGLFSQAVGWVLITNALPHVRAAQSGLILLLQPALAFVWDVLFFHRPTSIVNWIGVGIVLAGIYLGAMGSNTAKRPEQAAKIPGAFFNNRKKQVGK